MKKATDLIDHACVEVRRISHNLGTGMVASFGLVKSLEELCDGLNQTGKIRCNFKSHKMDQNLPVHIEIEIYRIVQEAVNNTIKHAKASVIDIQINRFRGRNKPCTLKTMELVLTFKQKRNPEV